MVAVTIDIIAVSTDPPVGASGGDVSTASISGT
jgi:hypothetical protein